MFTSLSISKIFTYLSDQPFIRPAIIEDCQHISKNLRETDRRELEAVRGVPVDYLKVLEENFKLSSICLCIQYKGNPVAIYGVATDLNNEDEKTGIVWMMATPELIKIKSWFIRNTEKIIGSVKADYKILWNLIDMRSTINMRWLERCGFIFGAIHEAFGPEKRPFQLFFMRVNPTIQ